MLKILILLILLVSACGQTGRLYLKDSQIITNSINQAHIKKLTSRQQQQQNFESKINELLAKRSNLIAQKKPTYQVDLKILELKQKIGNINLQRQKEGRNQ